MKPVNFFEDQLITKKTHTKFKSIYVKLFIFVVILSMIFVDFYFLKAKEYSLEKELSNGAKLTDNEIDSQNIILENLKAEKEKSIDIREGKDYINNRNINIDIVKYVTSESSELFDENTILSHFTIKSDEISMEILSVSQSKVNSIIQSLNNYQKHFNFRISDVSNSDNYYLIRLNGLLEGKNE